MLYITKFVYVSTICAHASFRVVDTCLSPLSAQTGRVVRFASKDSFVEAEPSSVGEISSSSSTPFFNSNSGFLETRKKSKYLPKKFHLRLSFLALSQANSSLPLDTPILFLTQYGIAIHLPAIQALKDYLEKDLEKDSCTNLEDLSQFMQWLESEEVPLCSKQPTVSVLVIQEMLKAQLKAMPFRTLPVSVSEKKALLRHTTWEQKEEFSNSACAVHTAVLTLDGLFRDIFLQKKKVTLREWLLWSSTGDGEMRLFPGKEVTVLSLRWFPTEMDSDSECSGSFNWLTEEEQI